MSAQLPYSVDELIEYLQAEHIRLQLKYSVYPDDVKEVIIKNDKMVDTAANLFIDQTYATPLEFGFIEGLSADLDKIWYKKPATSKGMSKLFVSNIIMNIPSSAKQNSNFISTGIETCRNSIAKQGIKAKDQTYEPSQEKRKIWPARYESTPQSCEIKNIKVYSKLNILAHYLALFANARLFVVSDFIKRYNSKNSSTDVCSEIFKAIDDKKIPTKITYIPTIETFDMLFGSSTKKKVTGEFTFNSTILPKELISPDLKLDIKCRMDKRDTEVKFTSYPTLYPGMPAIGYLTQELHQYTNPLVIKPTIVKNDIKFTGTTIIETLDINDTESPIVRQYIPNSVNEIDTQFVATRFNYSAIVQPKITVFNNMVYVELDCKSIMVGTDIHIKSESNSEIVGMHIGNRQVLTKEQIEQLKLTTASTASTASTAESEYDGELQP
jgi:hypothetical protein